MASWFYKIDDVEHGPISQAELLKMVQLGRLAADDMIRNETKEKWYQARDVKGLEFPGDNEPPKPKKTAKKTPKPPQATTSSEARNLLKGFGKKNKSNTESGTGETGKSESSTVDSWDARQKATARAVMAQPTARKPLDKRTKQIIWVAGGLLLLLLLFPPHQAPEGLTLTKKWDGRHAFLFKPPVMTLEAEKSMGNVDINNLKVEGDKTFIQAPMPINGPRTLYEGLVILAAAGAAIGILTAKKAAADIPDSKPAHPPRRRAV